jgi:hypothetical protein
MDKHWEDRAAEWMLGLVVLPLIWAQGRGAAIRVAAMLVALPWYVLCGIPFVLVVLPCLVVSIFRDLGQQP